MVLNPARMVATKTAGPAGPSERITNGTFNGGAGNSCPSWSNGTEWEFSGGTAYANEGLTPLSQAIDVGAAVGGNLSFAIPSVDGFDMTLTFVAGADAGDNDIIYSDTHTSGLHGPFAVVIPAGAVYFAVTASGGTGFIDDVSLVA